MVGFSTLGHKSISSASIFDFGQFLTSGIVLSGQKQLNMIFVGIFEDKKFFVQKYNFSQWSPLCSKLKIFNKKFLSRMILKTYHLRPFLSVEFKFGNENFVKPSGKLPKH